MTGVSELQTIKDWIAANRIWLAAAVIASLALMLFSLYYATTTRQPVAPGATVGPSPSNISSIKPLQQASLQVTSLASNNQPPTTTIKINNQPIDIPPSGAIHQVINNSNGTTTVDVSSDSKSSGAGNSNSSMNIEVNSVSQSSSTTESGQ